MAITNNLESGSKHEAWSTPGATMRCFTVEPSVIQCWALTTNCLAHTDVYWLLSLWSLKPIMACVSARMRPKPLALYLTKTHRFRHIACWVAWQAISDKLIKKGARGWWTLELHPTKSSPGPLAVVPQDIPYQFYYQRDYLRDELSPMGPEQMTTTDCNVQVSVIPRPKEKIIWVPNT